MSDSLLENLLQYEDCCGSCRVFIRDFEDKGKIYGHCKIKTRKASILAEDYKCPHYEMQPELRDHLGISAVSERIRKPRFDPVPDRSRRSRPRSHESRVLVKRRGSASVVQRTARVSVRDSEEVEFLDMDRGTFKAVVAELLSEMLGIDDVEIGERWQGGSVTLNPGNSDLQKKTIPMETFFKKVVMVRERLRVLEQKINNHSSLSDSEKVELQQYITRSYGSLTTFNVLFKSKRDHFVGDKK